jgi:hypothetical protein
LAHKDCSKILGLPQIDINTSIRELRAEHCAKAGWKGEALFEIDILFNIYQQEDRPYAFKLLLDKTGINPADLPSKSLLSLAWAYMRFDKVEESEFYLEMARPHETLDIAWKSAIQAELFKSTGNKAGALESVNKAIRICENALKEMNKTKKRDEIDLINYRLWGYRQDRARIKQYLFYEKEEALNEYEDLLNLKSGIGLPGFKIDIAIVQRNYSECLRTLSTSVSDEKWIKAKEVLSQAENNLQGYEQTPVYSEILYEKARIAEHEGEKQQEADFLINCQNAALKSNHFMMAAIAGSRLFWNTENFSMNRWISLSNELERYPYHGWAVRTLTNGRLKAAQRLSEMDDYVGGLGQLNENLININNNPAFDQGSDRFRIAATYAGIQLFNEKLGIQLLYWKEFISKYEWAAEWLSKQKGSSYNEIWAEVTF